MNEKLIAFPKMNHWYDKLSWHRARQVAKFVGYSANECMAARYKHDGRGISPDDKQFYMSALLDHIFCLTHEWEPFTKWEDLPEFVRDWYEKANSLELEEWVRRYQKIEEIFAHFREERPESFKEDESEPFMDGFELDGEEFEQASWRESDVMDRRRQIKLVR